MQNIETKLTNKQLASKRNIKIAIAANAKRRKNYFKKKIETNAIVQEIAESNNSKADQEDKAQNIAQQPQEISEQSQNIEQVQKYTKPVSELTLKRRANKLSRLIADEQDNYLPEKRRFIRKEKNVKIRIKRKFLSLESKQKFVYQLRQNEMKMLRQFLEYGKNTRFAARYIVGPPGTGKTTSVLILAEQVGFKEQQVLIVHELKLDSWRQTFLSQIGIKATKQSSKYLFDKYMKMIRLFIIDEFDLMNPQLISQILAIIYELGGTVVLIGCSVNILEQKEMVQAKKYLQKGDLFFVGYQNQGYYRIIQRIYPQIQPFQRLSMINSFLMRSYDLRRLIQFIGNNKNKVFGANNPIKVVADQQDFRQVFTKQLERRCKECVLTSFIIFMLEKSKDDTVSLRKLAKAVQQHFSQQEILYKATQLCEIGVLRGQFKKRKYNEHRDWKKQDFTPTWYFQKTGQFSWLSEPVSKFYWTDLIPFSRARVRVKIDDQDYPEQVTPVIQTPVYSSAQDIQIDLELQSRQRLFHSDSDQIPEQNRQIESKREIAKPNVEPDRYANLVNNLRPFLKMQKRLIQTEIRKRKERNQPKIPDQMPKPRHLRGIPPKEIDQLSNFRGMRFKYVRE